MAQRILIIGCGSMGLLLAARLASAGADINLACRRSNQVEKIMREGIRIEHNGQAVAKVSAAHIEMLPRYNYDIVIVAVKSFNVYDVIDYIKTSLRKEGVAVSIQNGLGAYEAIAEAIGEKKTLYMALYIGAYRLNDNTVVFSGGKRIYIGAIGIGGAETSRKGEILASMLQDAGFEAKYVDNVEAWRWDKLVVNASINPITAVLGMPNAVIYRNEKARVLAEALALEVAALAKLKNISLPRDPVNAVVETAKETAPNKSSMLQDIEARRRTEIDFINGAIVSEANRHGLYVPVNYTMYLLVKALEQALGIE